MAKISGTWRWNDTIISSANVTEQVAFRSGQYHQEMVQISIEGTTIKYFRNLNSGEFYSVYSEAAGMFEVLREMEFGGAEQEVSDEFYNFLIINAQRIVLPAVKGRWRWYDGIENAPAPPYLLIEKASFISGVVYGDGSRTYGTLNIGGDNRVSISYMFSDDPSSGYAAVYSSINSGEIVSHVNENLRIMDFGETEQEVSEEFYNFLVANAECLPTIAEKLTMIAENEQKVFDAGYAKGKAEGGDSGSYEQGYADGKAEQEAYTATLIDRSVTELCVPKTITEVGAYAFYYCASLTNIKIPSHITMLRQYAFAYCTNLNTVEFEEGVTTLEVSVFFTCPNLEEVVLPDSITYLGNSVFHSCTGLKKAVLGRGITTVRLNGFNGCTSLEEVIFNGDVKSVAQNVFNGCSACKKYDFSNCTTVPSLTAVSAFNGINAEAKIIVPSELLSAWKSATNWSQFADYIVAAE